MSAAGVLVTGGFDDLGSRHVRFLQECSRLGDVTVLLWEDAAIQSALGAAPKFPLAERRYLLEGLRFVSRVLPVADDRPLPAATSDLRGVSIVCVDNGALAAEVQAGRRHAAAIGAPLRVVEDRELEGFPDYPVSPPNLLRRRVVVTGCYDWLHSGHVRFFEEVAGHGELYVVVGSDANVRLLKGKGHPRFPQEKRRYMVGAVRHVHQCLVSTGSGWMDAEPEIRTIDAHIYAVNEDGDKPEKREFCRENGLEYLVLSRVPAAGLPRRSSTDLRGF